MPAGGEDVEEQTTSQPYSLNTQGSVKMSPLKLIPRVTVDDSASVARSNMLAFYQEPWWSPIWEGKPLEDIIKTTRERMGYRLLRDRATYRHQMVIDQDTGETVGYARWILPDTATEEWLEAQVPDVGDEDKKKFAEMHNQANFNPSSTVDCLDDWVDENKEKYAPRSPYIKLDYLGVRPDYQRKGIASMLVKSGVEVANKLQLEIYMIVMQKKARDMYAKQGFVSLAENTQTLKPWGSDEPYQNYLMLRKPNEPAQ